MRYLSVYRTLAAAAAMLLPAAGCHNRAPVVPKIAVDPMPHKAAVAAVVKPLMDVEYASGVVIGLYDAGKTEVYGFGKGPGNQPPTASTLFEIGSITKVFTTLLLADSVERQEVSLQTDLADLLPPGVTVPVADHRTITLGQLATHTSGLPPMPPSIAGKSDAGNPYAHYSEDQLFADLVRAQLVAPPGTHVVFSNFGAGVLGYALGRKLGLGYEGAVLSRVVDPLGLGSTFFQVPEGAKFRRATGTNSDLTPVPYWYYGALAGAGALISDAHDMLALIEAELDASSGSALPLRHAMRFTQEQALDHTLGESAGLGWQIDTAGRFWHTGQTGGFHSFVGFDPKTRRGVVVLASTASQLLDRLGEDMYRVLSGDPPRPLHVPSPTQTAEYQGTYSLGGENIAIVESNKRLYIVGRGVPAIRLLPISENELWIEPLQAVIGFQQDPATQRVVQAIFLRQEQKIIARRISDSTVIDGGIAPPGAPVVPAQPAPPAPPQPAPGKPAPAQPAKPASK